MPNGKPGDHPLTDIVVHGIRVFGPEIDDKIRRIHAEATPAIKSHLGALLWAWPRQNTSVSSPVVDPNNFAYVLDSLRNCVSARRQQS